MNSAMRAFGVIAVFGLIGPPFGVAVLLLFAFAGSGGRVGPINWSDFPCSVVELGAKRYCAKSAGRNRVRLSA